MNTQKPSIKKNKAEKLSAGSSGEVRNDITPQSSPQALAAQKEREIGGFENRLEPTRYGDWESGGRCSDF